MSIYEQELARLAETYVQATNTDVTALKDAIAGASCSSIIGVGSGGSFTVASLLCNLHEAFTGRVSRASTPLEIICNPTLAATSPVFMVSAEGKNPDIVTALKRARSHSARAVHVISNKLSSPLLDISSELRGVQSHIFEAKQKDGYLATNTLLLDSILIARAYAELDDDDTEIPSTIDAFRIGELSLQDWLANAAEFVAVTAKRGAVFITYSPLLHPVAADFESKLAEAALLYCQIADLRSFAHGRHLWATKRTDDCTFIAIVEPSLERLWSHTRSLIPSNATTLTMGLSGAKPMDLIAGLIAEMHLINLIGKLRNIDPAKPGVPQSGADIYYTPVDDLVDVPTEETDWGETAKANVLGSSWPSRQRARTIPRASEEYRSLMESRDFRAVVFDYDGTLCSSQKRDQPPPSRIIEHLKRLISSGIVIAIASGRGDSLQNVLQNVLPKEMWGSVLLALYSGGWIKTVDVQFEMPNESDEFLSHVARILRRLEACGAPIQSIHSIHPFQVSARFRDGVDTYSMWFVIADSLREAGLNLFSTVRSKHSVDILAPGVSKVNLIKEIISRHQIEPYQILTMGDQGAWPGNDYDLLEHRFSLSVDTPSRRIDRGWKFAPRNCSDVIAAEWYLDRMILINGSKFRIKFRT